MKITSWKASKEAGALVTAEKKDEIIAKIEKAKADAQKALGKKEIRRTLRLIRRTIRLISRTRPRRREPRPSPRW